MHHTQGRSRHLLAALALGLLALAAQAKPQQAAADAVLARFFGSDDVHFAQTSTSLPGVTRHYASFTQAADENGLSRILVGFHFRHAVDMGRIQGEQVGRWVFEHALGAVK